MFSVILIFLFFFFFKFFFSLSFLQELAKKGDFYKVRAKAGQQYSVASVPAKMLFDSLFHDEVSLNFDDEGNFRDLDYSVSFNTEDTNSNTWKTQVRVRAPQKNQG
jgi:hypothetical protein